MAVAGLVLSWAWSVVLAVLAGAGMMLVVQNDTTPAASSSVVTNPSAVPTPVVSAPPSVAASPSPRPPVAPHVRPKKVRIKDLRIGHCVDREPDQTFVTLPVVPCAQPHDVEIYAMPSLGTGRWPGEAALHERADKACRTPFGAYVGIPYDLSTLEIGWYAPTQDSWRAGDRRVHCVLRDPAGRLAGTMKGRAL